MACDREGRDASRELFADEPMTPAASTQESDFLIVRANLKEEAFRTAFPSPYEDSLGRIDSNVARHESHRQCRRCLKHLARDRDR